MKNSRTKLIILFVLAILFTSCSTNNEENIDTTEPMISIQSPQLNQTYVGYWGGAWPEADKVNLIASGVDETGISSIKLTVINESKTVVFEKIVNSTTSSQTELVISENFTPQEIGTYSVIFSVTDVIGNIETSAPRTFLVE
ncbi:hypothetical protein BW723_12880 [Polaribacter reichenbachii]|uniref:Ig-like domain-containing protein n=1 Tax=Polaribacter reichenbachii TaxID=996801 RepID=A0A1B8U007_9FLAO|nr:Ig-like domain repeat protein [Polaribacter reichenbachii]APZ47122.1 hypothetical protein BW723_12880 [Polaribacter reichenbachii]AUC17763.1 hypothetical protein BTO17_03330 [Polaribacter reichenbachii]OBY65214.1 hypothetical protein LPB301_08900 [Polaribacter reichenbachii]